MSAVPARCVRKPQGPVWISVRSLYRTHSVMNKFHVLFFSGHVSSVVSFATWEALSSRYERERALSPSTGEFVYRFTWHRNGISGIAALPYILPVERTIRLTPTAG